MFLYLNIQIRVLVEDGGQPSLVDTTIIQVNVNRNNFAPSFGITSYPVTILETNALGTPIVRVVATDMDTKVSSYINVIFLTCPSTEMQRNDTYCVYTMILFVNCYIDLYFQELEFAVPYKWSNNNNTNKYVCRYILCVLLCVISWRAH